MTKAELIEMIKAEKAKPGAPFSPQLNTRRLPSLPVVELELLLKAARLPVTHPDRARTFARAEERRVMREARARWTVMARERAMAAVTR